MEAAMKAIITVILAVLLAWLAPSGAYAIVEIAGYGGYTWGRHMIYYPARDTDRADGLQFGGHAHLTTALYPVQLGAGLFHNSSVLDTRKDGDDSEVIRRTTGFSVALQISIPATDLAVYGKGGFSFYDHYILKPDTGARRTKGRLFSTSTAGAGLAYTLYGPLALFTEYQYFNSKYDNGDREFFRTHSVNVGLKVSI
jgi:opacity protein-like surface antigen